MSWDITMLKTKTSFNDLFDINEGDVIPFDSSNVIEVLTRNCKGIDCSDKTWYIYDKGIYAFELEVADENEIMMYAHISDEGERCFVELLQKLCIDLECSAFDTGNGKLIYSYSKNMMQ